MNSFETANANERTMLIELFAIAGTIETAVVYHWSLKDARNKPLEPGLLSTEPVCMEKRSVACAPIH